MTGDLAMGRKKPRIECPFHQARSLTARAWMLCATDGISVEDLIEWVKRQGGDPVRVLRVMRSCSLNGVRWSLDDRNGFLKISDVQL